MFWFYCFIVTLSVAILSVSSIWLVRYLLVMYQVEDIPNERSNHSAAVPRGAGIAMMVPILGFMMVTGAPHLLLWAALGVMVISFMDDLESIPFQHRLLIQFAALFLAVPDISGLVFQGLLPGWLDGIVAGLMLLIFMNLYNFMDGIDGITGAQTIAFGLGFLGLGIALPHPDLMGLPADGLILMAAAASFLLFNWHPAKVFMGDSGSVPLGLIVGFLLLQTAASGYYYAAAILPAYYLVDAGITLISRLIRQEKIWQAHSEHAYQQAVRAGWPHDKVVIWISRLNGGLIVLAVIAALWPDYGYVPLALAYIGAWGLWRHFHQVKQQGEVIPPAGSKAANAA